jgi:hypothetical protein
MESPATAFPPLPLDAILRPRGTATLTGHTAAPFPLPETDSPAHTRSLLSICVQQYTHDLPAALSETATDGELASLHKVARSQRTAEEFL